MAKWPDILIFGSSWNAFMFVSHLSLGQWLASVFILLTDPFHVSPSGSESSIPVDVARQRELKWLEMFSHWDKWLSRRFQKV